MVKDAVENQTHAQLLRIVPQAQQRPVAAKLRINMTVIFGIVFMHARGGKYRIQIQRRDPNVFRYGSFSLMPSKSPP